MPAALRPLHFVLLFVALTAGPVHAQGLSLFAPTTAQTGAPFRVGFNGAPGPGDRIVFAYRGESNAVVGEYDSTVALGASPAVVAAPFVPGDYDLLYILGDGTIAARLPVDVSPARASVSAMEVVAPGAELPVYWTGPAGPMDFLVFAVPGTSPDRTVGTEVGDLRDNPVVLRAPDEPGTYEIRYVQRVISIGIVLARQQVQVR